VIHFSIHLLRGKQMHDPAAAAASFSGAEGGTMAELSKKEFSRELQTLFEFASFTHANDGDMKELIGATPGLLDHINQFFTAGEKISVDAITDETLDFQTIKSKIYRFLASSQQAFSIKADDIKADDLMDFYRTQITELARVKDKKEIPYQEINNLLNSLIYEISDNIGTPASMPAAQQDAWDNLLGHGQVGGSESVDPSQGGGAAAAAPKETTSARQEDPKATFLNHVEQLGILYRCKSMPDSMLRKLQEQIFGVDRAGLPDGKINSLYCSLNLAAAKKPATSVPAAALKTEEAPAAKVAEAAPKAALEAAKEARGQAGQELEEMHCKL
jgi:hypothetical protein